MDGRAAPVRASTTPSAAPLTAAPPAPPAVPLTAPAPSLGSRERRERIVELAVTSGLAGVDDLAVTFDVTASTIRRDLAQLTADGLLTRTYGGAIASPAHPESSLRQRSGEAFEAKRGIARWAAAQVQLGEVVLLDAGSTLGAMAHELRGCRDVTVATTGLTVLSELADVADVRVECLGGTLRHVSEGFVGPLTELALARMSFDRVFLGADSVTAEDGICEADLVQTHLKELMMRRTERTYVLAHADKLGRRPFHAWAALPPRCTLVTDSGASDAAVRPFLDRGVAVVRAAPDGSAT